MNKLKTLAGSIGSRRLQVSAEALLFGVCAFFALVFNLPFWRGASQFLGTMSVQVGRDLLLMGMVITCLHFLLLLPFVNRYTLKPILSLLVIAGAGSGKTSTLAHRVAHLLMNGVDPRRILLMTFSRRASSELTRRVEKITAQAMGTGFAAEALSWAI